MEKCCSTCGMLESNRGKETPKGGTSNIDWYSQENMNRLWESTRKYGEYLICHKTDSNPDQNGGVENIKKGRETACVGLATWIFMHIKIYEVSAKLKYNTYKRLVGPNVAIDQLAMGKLALNMAHGTTGFTTQRDSIFSGMLIPRAFDQKQEIRFPDGFAKTVELFNEISGLKMKHYEQVSNRAPRRKRGDPQRSEAPALLHESRNS